MCKLPATSVISCLAHVLALTMRKGDGSEIAGNHCASFKNWFVCKTVCVCLCAFSVSTNWNNRVMASGPGNDSPTGPSIPISAPWTTTLNDSASAHTNCCVCVWVFLCGCLVIWVRGCSQANVNVCNLTEFLCSCSQYLIQLKAISMYGIQYFLMMHWWYGNRVSVWGCCHGGCAWSLRVFGQMVWIQWHINMNARVKVECSIFHCSRVNIIHFNCGFNVLADLVCIYISRDIHISIW